VEEGEEEGVKEEVGSRIPDKQLSELARLHSQR
jgi:hypothetical protein